MALETTWTAKDAVAFTAGTLGDIDDCTTQVQSNLNRGTLSATTVPSTTEVSNWLIRAKEEIQEIYGFTWRRVFKYASTAAGTSRYALPADYAGGTTILRDTTSNKRLDFADPISFDSMFPDADGNDNGTPDTFTIKDRELWLQAPANGTYVLELEYSRSGDDSTSTDVSYIPEALRFKMCDRATALAFRRLKDFQAMQAYNVDFGQGMQASKHSDAKKKWTATGYRMLNWHNVK